MKAVLVIMGIKVLKEVEEAEIISVVIRTVTGGLLSAIIGHLRARSAT